MSKKYFIGLLSFYSNCHCEFSCIYFLDLTNQYCVLLRSPVCQKCILLIFSSIWTTLISIVIVNLGGSTFWVLLIYNVSYQVLLRSSVYQKFILLVCSSIWTTFITIVIVNYLNLFFGVLLIYIVSFLGPQNVKNTFCLSTHLYGQLLFPLLLSIQLDLFFGSY